jgi:peptide deformylase
MNLVHYPDPILRRRAAPLLDIDQEVRERAAQMFEVMYREKGVGLAAPQVGWSARLFVTNPAGEEDPSGEQVYINPRIIEQEGEDVQEEGCLSIPDVRGRVARSAELWVEAQDLGGVLFRKQLAGLPARIFQHELDHLDGILFIIHLSPSERLLANKVLKRLEKEYRKKADR